MKIFLQKTLLVLLILGTVITENIIKESFFNSNKIYAQKKGIRTFRPDYRDQDINDFLKLMSALIGKNIITDDKVKGKITVVSPRRIPINEALKYLTAVLAIKGLGIIEEGSILKVVPIKDAIASSQIIIYSNNPWMNMTDKEIGSYSPGNISKEIIKKEKIITQIIEIINSNPTVIGSTLKKLTNSKTEIVTFKEGNLLIITGGPLEVNRLVKLVAYIDFDDKEIEKEENVSEELSFGRFHVYRLENMEATDVVNTLNRLSIPENFGELYNLKVDKITVQRTEIKNEKEKNKKRRKKKEEEKIKYKKLNLVAHKESNSILYIGTKKEYQQVEKLIKRIDLQRDQVFLEVLIAEISSGGGKQDGVDPVSVFELFANLPTMTFPISETVTNNNGEDRLQTGQAGIFDVIERANDPVLTGALFGLSAFGRLFRFLRTQENVNILSAPQVMTVENQEATISSTEKVPIIRTTSTQQNTQSSVDYRDVGIKLKVKPRITRDKNIHIELEQEVGSIIDSASISTQGVVAPSFRERKVKTTLRIKDDQTIAIGGLLINEEIFTTSKIPLLGDIPVIGLLFKRKQKNIRKRSLFIFITPHIVTSKKRADQLTEDVMKTYRKKLKEFESKQK